MASIRKRGNKYRVMWRDPDGRQRGKTCPNLTSARSLKLEVEMSVAVGRRWAPVHEVGLPDLIVVDQGQITGGMFFDFLEDAGRRFATGTMRHYRRALLRYAEHLRASRPRGRLTVDLLSRASLASWYEAMKEGREISTLRLLVGAVHQAWEWAYDADYPYGEDVVPRPKRLKMPSPVVRLARAPSWSEMDAAISACYSLSRSSTRSQVTMSWVWRARLLTVMRCTGLRVTQVLRLRWDDIEGDMLLVRPELGKSRQEKTGRIIPLSPVLLSEFASWGRREGWLVAPEKKIRRDLDPRPTRKAWETANVHPRVWGGESKGQPHHAFRKGFKTGLAKLGVESHVRDYLLGHRLGLDGHYLDVGDQARNAVALVPPLGLSGVAIALPSLRVIGEKR